MQASNAAAGAYGVSAGMDLLSGVFGYLSAQNAASIARSRADLVRVEAEANAQRYAEQAAQFQAHQKVMYLSSGVKLSGSPVDVLATTARVANENIAAIRAGGDTKAMDEEITATNEEMKGRDALAGGFRRASGMGFAAVGVATGDHDLMALSMLGRG